MIRITRLLILYAVAGATAPAAMANCTWTTPPPTVLFGNYSAFGPIVSANVTYSIRCTPNDAATITFTTGANATAYFPRYMKSGVNLLAYNLYDDAANSLVLGDGNGGTTVRTLFNGDPGNKTYTDTIYGSIPAGLDAPPGTYTDTVTAIMDSNKTITSRTFTVQTTVIAECTVSTTPLIFGNYDPVGVEASTALDAPGSIDVFCTSGTPVTVSLANGLYFTTTRRMSGPSASFLNYQLYTTAARTTIWNATNTVGGTSTSKLIAINNGFTVFGRIPAGQDPNVGSYTDTVQATVNY